MKTFIAVLIVIAVAIVGYEVVHHAPTVSVSTVATSTESGASTTSPVTVPLHNQVTYFCTEGSFDALFTDKQVTLSINGRTLVLPQAVSGSGIRYEANGATLVGKGNNAMLTENGKDAYTNCIAGSVSASGTGTGLRAFRDASGTFTFAYPAAFTLSGGEMGYTQSWRANATTSGLVLAVVTIPRSFEPGTNFSEAKFTVGVSSDPYVIANCATPINGESPRGTISISGHEFTKYVIGDAAAGNLYMTTSYDGLYDGDCYSLEYTVHSTQLANYDPSQGIKAFDQAKVQNALEGIVKSFAFLVQPE